MFIAHRVNYMDEEISSKIFSYVDGIEFDVRDNGVCHDPWKPAQLLDEFIKWCPPDKFYIVNIKCEGIEENIIEILDKNGIHNFFLLDCTIPSIIRLTQKGEKRIAIRYSEYESFDNIILLADRINWVWIDVFSKLPISTDIINKIHSYNLKICLVSPELQGQPDKIIKYRDSLINMGILLDAVCSKISNYTIWKNFGVLFPYPN
jgi:hypothetical protein